MSGLLSKALFVLLPISLAVGDAKAQSSYDLRSPNNRIELRNILDAAEAQNLQGGHASFRPIMQFCFVMALGFPA